MNMMSPKGKTLIIDDDLGPRLLMNKIFGQMISKMNIIEFIQKINFKYDNLSIYEIHHEGQIAYVLEVYRQRHTKSINVEWINRINLEIPKSYLYIFKEYFLYCKKNDLEKMYSKLKEEYKDEFYDKIISEFVTGISIIQIEY